MNQCVKEEIIYTAEDVVKIFRLWEGTMLNTWIQKHSNGINCGIKRKIFWKYIFVHMRRYMLEIIMMNMYEKNVSDYI